MRISPCNRYIVFIGTEGTIILVCRHTKQWIANLKMNNDIVDICFSADKNSCYSLGTTGEIYEWDLDTYRCKRIVHDDGAIQCTTIAISPNNEFMAIG